MLHCLLQFPGFQVAELPFAGSVDPLLPEAANGSVPSEDEYYPAIEHAGEA